jgi:signal peptide peptidase SppA
MTRPLLQRLLPPPLRRKVPVVPVIRLSGVIGGVSPLRPGLTLASLDPLIERAFGYRDAAAVALAVNSPGGSAVQSSLIASRIRALAAEKNLKVIAFVEDVAASGGYWLACAADEIIADRSSIVGSIGVISASFGFVAAMEKLGIERRVHTAGEHKSILDPFLPEKQADVARLKALQQDVHEEFKALVRDRRRGKLDETAPDLFSGAFWSGAKAKELGLIDGFGGLHDVLRARFGKEVEIVPVARKQGLFRLPFQPSASQDEFLNRVAQDLPEGALAALEWRTHWSKYGL